MISDCLNFVIIAPFSSIEKIHFVCTFKANFSDTKKNSALKLHTEAKLCFAPLAIENRALFQSPLFKIPSFMYVLRVITAKCVMLRCKV